MGPEAAAGNNIQHGGDSGAYIVRFKDYKMAGEHRRQLQRSLAGRGLSWRWVHRRNQATKFPTDFGVLQLSEPAGAMKVCSVTPNGAPW